MDDRVPRSKRNIKTPKRFDDEAFEPKPSPKHQAAAKQTEATATAKPAPEPTTPRNIIKVKLAKARPRESIKLTTPTAPKEHPIKLEPSTKESNARSHQKEPTKLKDPNKSKESINNEQLKDSIKLEEPTGVSELKEPAKLRGPSKLKDSSTKPVKESVKHRESNKFKDTAKVKEPVKPKEPVVKTPKDVVKHKDTTPKPKELTKLKEFPKIEIKTPERDSQLVYRPKTKRPRTPPIYTDLIPNVVLPFWDARTAAEEHEDDNVKELVHCHCGIAEELGLMVQCETCLTWQHAHCLGIERPEEAPDGYTCRACSDPKFARDSMKWAYDQDWLTKGRMKQFPCDLNPIPEKRMKTMKQINQLINHVLQIHQLIHSLKVKSRILLNAQDDDSELKLFRNQWPANYQHQDGTHFLPTINQPSSTPASTISAIPDTETPDPGEINVETVADVPLPDIGQLDDVTAILEGSYVSSQPPTAAQTQPLVTNNEVTPNDCRANLRLHIQQTEEFIGMELAQIEEQLVALEKDCSSSRGSSFETSIESLKNDLQTIKKYIALNKCEN